MFAVTPLSKLNLSNFMAQIHCQSHHALLRGFS